MARRDLAAVANDAGRARLELEFEQPYLLGPLFGDYDRHLITIENGSACTSPRAATGCRSRARPTPRRAPATC